jgi:ubiquinol-cytochrome c reductase iron-sulfur subunit
MCASADVLALASAEFAIGNIAESTSITVKWRGKPVFINHRSAADIEAARSVDVNDLRDPEADEDRVQDPKWFVSYFEK